MTNTLPDNIIIENQNLIYKIINKYTYFFDREDLYQVAMIGLITAYKNFNSNMNTKFTSYAYFYIIGEVKKYIRESNYFKVSKELVRINSKLEKIREVLINKLGREPTDEEISIFSGISYEKQEEARLANLLVTSIDKENDDERSIYETIGNTPIEYDESILDLKEEIKKLDIESQKIIKSRYENGLTQSETSEYLGISQVQVSRKEKAILTRLRKNLS